MFRFVETYTSSLIQLRFRPSVNPQDPNRFPIVENGEPGPLKNRQLPPDRRVLLPAAMVIENTF
jgi:hypothetical protein